MHVLVEMMPPQGKGISVPLPCGSLSDLFPMTTKYNESPTDMAVSAQGSWIGLCP